MYRKFSKGCQCHRCRRTKRQTTYREKKTDYHSHQMYSESYGNDYDYLERKTSPFDACQRKEKGTTHQVSNYSSGCRCARRHSHRKKKRFICHCYEAY